MEQVAKLVIRDLHKTFGDHEVLKGISLDANAGDVISIIGSSGSGKSTLLRCINFLEQPSNGTIKLNGEKLRTVFDKKGNLKVVEPKQLQKMRTQLMMVFQHFNLWSHMTVLENVIEGPIHVLGVKRSEAEERAHKYLRKVGLPESVESKYPAFLSGGQQQRVAIARALAVDAKIVIADEPTGNLDEENTQEVISIFQELAHEVGKTVIIVTHEPNVAKAADIQISLKNRQFTVV